MLLFGSIPRAVLLVGCLLLVVFVVIDIHRVEAVPAFRWSSGRHRTPTWEKVCSGGEFPWCDEPSFRPQPLRDDDQVHVRYMQAPLFYTILKDLLGQVNLFHSGIGLTSTLTGNEYTLSFDAVEEVKNSTFPFVVDAIDGIGKEVVWCNNAAVCISPKIDRTYWFQRFDLGFINGTVFNQLMNWIPEANETFAEYETFNVFSSWPEGPLLWSKTCADFAFAGLSKIVELGGQLNPTDPPTDNKVSAEQKALRHDYMNIYGDIELISADELATNVTLATEMVDFFNKFGFYNYSSEWALLELIVEFLASDKFVLHEDQYYRVRAKAPFVWYHYAPADLCPYDKWLVNRCFDPGLMKLSSTSLGGRVQSEWNPEEYKLLGDTPLEHVREVARRMLERSKAAGEMTHSTIDLLSRRLNRLSRRLLSNEPSS